MSPPRVAPAHRAALLAALAGALGLGLLLRWFLAGDVSLSLPFRYVRHAHSHLGYYGLLFPLAWVGWAEAGAPSPGRRVGTVYAVATAVAVVGFLRAGYGPAAIGGSTVIAAVWLWSAWRLRGRTREVLDPLGAVLPGVVLAEACIPAIALTLRRAPDVADGLVATFLGVLLLCVLVPSALAARGFRAPWPLLLVAGALGAAHLGVWAHPVAATGLAVYAVALARAFLPPRRGDEPLWPWAAAGLGMLALAVGALPNTRPVALGAVHFAVLGPILGTLGPGVIAPRLPPWAWHLHHAAAAAMSAALVLQGLGSPWGSMRAAAVGGTAVGLWWAAALVVGAARGRDAR